MEDNELYELERMDTSLDRQCIRGCRACIFATLDCDKQDIGVKERRKKEVNIDNFYNGD